MALSLIILLDYFTVSTLGAMFLNFVMFLLSALSSSMPSCVFFFRCALKIKGVLLLNDPFISTFIHSFISPLCQFSLSFDPKSN